MGKEDEEEYEIMRETQFEDNLIKQITFDNLRKKNNHIRLLLSKIQQQVVDNSVARNNFHNVFNNNVSLRYSSESSTEFIENDSADNPINVVFSNNIEMTNTLMLPRPEFCKSIGIESNFYHFKPILHILKISLYTL